MSWAWFILGFCLGYAVVFGFIFWFCYHPRSPVVVLDPWWLEGEDRWASLRDIIREKRSAR